MLDFLALTSQFFDLSLVIWGKNYPFFDPKGMRAFERDLKTTEVHLLDTGYFALKEEGEAISDRILCFISTHVTA